MFKNKYKISYHSQSGGNWTEFKEQSNCEVNAYLFNLKNNISNTHCPHSYYNYSGLDAEKVGTKCAVHEALCTKLGHDNVKTNGTKCLDCLKDIELRTRINNPEENEIINEQSARYKINYEIEKVCQPITGLDVNFRESPIRFIRAINIETNNQAVGDIQSDILLSTTKYLNSPVNNTLITDKHLICLEGNLVHVDQLSRVATGHIDTCLFVTLEFDDLTSISFHINGMLSNNSIASNYVLKAMSYPVEPTKVFTYLNDNFPGKFPTLNKIYLVGMLDDYALDTDTDSNGFIWYNGSLTQLGLMGNLTILSIMKRKLNVPTAKSVQLIKKNSPGDYIYAGNTMYMMKK